jgi:hypothetical protein
VVFEGDRASIKENLKNEGLKSRGGKVFIQFSRRDRAKKRAGKSIL